MYKHLLVAVDGSHTSENALEHAIGLAKSEEAELTVVNVANPTEYMALAPEFLQHESYEAAALSEGNTVLDDAVNKALKQLPQDRVHRHLLIANKGAKEMAQMLVDYADEKSSDLIILGTHGRSGLMHLLMGSFAETVMRETNLPLLIIRSDTNGEG
ncbi:MULTISPECIES: universal stress protein [Snodgrassella]|uniref:universal stress protein n=1 Tax=Snodgrassella TaxID=1193515 RepID=UPI000C1F86C0|nr:MULTISPECIES: universal stress protein [Snodgrassella]MCT6880984.1 universal stress protein [Snodgrassella alvi]MCX8747356.1 universal stress protein [Snodgrassella sp. B3800]MCX8752585.1 universal stress protein [Snodgrassella sp. B3837]PIT39202.1 universal stress protein [Snodgrassella alvi]PIT40456.1 universal stress protein [Snodgrassella alvi]